MSTRDNPLKRPLVDTHGEDIKLILPQRRCAGRNCCLKTLAFLSNYIHHKSANRTLPSCFIFLFLLLKALNLVERKATNSPGHTQFPPKSQITYSTYSKLFHNAGRDDYLSLKDIICFNSIDYRCPIKSLYLREDLSFPKRLSKREN